jgi:hypothetical protein
MAIALVLMIKRTLAISAPILGGFDAIKYVANGSVDENTLPFILIM